MEIPDRLREFINESRQPLPPIADSNEPLQLDSLAIIKLVSFLESEIGYTVQDEELILANFENLNAIARMMESRGAKVE